MFFSRWTRRLKLEPLLTVNPNSLFSRNPLLTFMFIKETGLKRTINQTKVKSELNYNPVTQMH